MPAKSKEHALFEHEREFWNAMKQKDGRRTARMTDEHCIVVGAQGVSAIDGPTMERLTVEGNWTIEQFSFDEEGAQVQFIGNDVAIIAYNVNERVVIDGKTLPIDANDSSVWVRRNGEWLCALHTESLSGDPFGRDKRA